MTPVLIIEPHAELATALEEVVASAWCLPLVRRHVASLSDLEVRPASIVLRVGHADVSGLRPDRPPVVAIAFSEEDVAEAERLRYEVVLRAPSEVRRLCEVLRSLAVSSGPRAI